MPEVQCQQQVVQTINIHKFGGSSLKDASQISKVVKTIQSKVNKGDFVVVSANGKVTDYLLAWINGDRQALQKLSQYLNHLVKSVLTEPDELIQIINQDLNQMATVEFEPLSNHHHTLALGELWSAQLLSAKLNENQLFNHWLDARAYLVMDSENLIANRELAAKKLWRTSKHCSHAQGGGLFNIITGFIALDQQGQSTTLGRNGSDYTATLLADLLQASTVYLWTDVNGIFTADPNLISDARRIEQLTTCEAHALAELGSNVLHQKSVTPISHQTTKLVINSCGVNSLGTAVQKLDKNCNINQANQTSTQVKTLALKGNLVWLTLHNVVEQAAQSLQLQLTLLQINTFAKHYDKTQELLTFCVEADDWIKVSQIVQSAGLNVSDQLKEVSLISAVGHDIRQNQQTISEILRHTSAFNIHNIHYPDNNHSLTVMLSDEQAYTLLAVLHQELCIPEIATPVVVLGYGNISQQFLKTLKANKISIEKRVNQKLAVVAIANSRCYQSSTSCLLEQEIRLNQSNRKGEVFQVLKSIAGKSKIIIDLTASETVANQYVNLAQQGWHLISANKIAAANKDQATFIELNLKKLGRKWLKNTTVGAALPIQKTINKIQASGDGIKQVSGVFSGSLSWLLGRYDGTTEFMQWVKQAQENGLTEPDPRADLSGQDVYKKSLILAKELGFEPKKITFKPVVPTEYLTGTIDEFWQHEEAINKHIKALWEKAQKKQQQLRYLATIKANQLCIELAAVSDEHAAAVLKPGDNIFIVESNWYSDNPLVIQGPGAGREVTASGVLTDLIDILNQVD